MIKAIYLTGLVVAAAFTLLWLLIDDMRRVRSMNTTRKTDTLKKRHRKIYGDHTGIT